MTIAWIYTGFSIVSVVGIPLGTVIADHWRWQDAFIMCAVITAIATIVAFTILPKNLQAGEGNYRDQIQIFKDKTIGMALFSLSVERQLFMATILIFVHWFINN